MAIESGADEGTEHTGTSNGVSTRDAARAAFLAGMESEQEVGKGDESDADDSSADDDADLDSALDGDGDADEVDADADDSDAEDDDSDLDEDEDETEGDDEKVDGDTAKRLEKVRRTDKRLREQRDRDFKAREAELEQKVQAANENLRKEWEPRIEKAERVERLMASRDLIALAKEAGYSEDDFADAARMFYAYSPDGAKDPKAKDAAARLRKEREQQARLDKLEKEREEERKERERELKQAEQQKHVDTFVGKVTKAVSDKLPLAKAYIAAEPDEARVEIEVIAGRIAQQLGRLPEPKAVMVELEKLERRRLRRHGIDPKSVKAGSTASSAIAKAGTTDSKTKPAPKKGDKKTTKKSADEAGDEKKLSPKEEFMRLNGNYD